jgi:hypothetical protein
VHYNGFMTASWNVAAATLVEDLKNIFGNRLVCVLAYGPHLDGDTEAPLSCMAIVSAFDIADLEECARRADRWKRQELAVPLILPEEELRRSLDAFPLEYCEIMRTHELVLGTDPFEHLVIGHEDLRRACETQIKSHLVHLREGFIEASGRPGEVAALVQASAPAFAALLRSVARLNGVTARSRAETTREGARAAHLPDGIVDRMLALEQREAVPAVDPARLFPEYLASVERLARDVDIRDR